MDIRLVVWSVFGGLGSAFFLLLIELLRRFNSGKNTGSKESTLLPNNSSSSTAPSFCFPTENLLPVLTDFPLQQLHTATNGFSSQSLLKESSSAKIYTGILHQQPVVIKRLESREQFDCEARILAELGSSERILEIVGICGEERMLVLKQLPNGDLASALRRGDEVQSKNSDGESIQSSSDQSSESSSGSSGSPKPLDWITRFKIAIGVAEALVFLHHRCSPPVIHRDLKSSSVLLDEAYEIRLGSLGKACRQQASDQSQYSYDVYCYGKVLLDLISGLDVSGGCDPFAEAWMNKAVPLMEFGRQEELGRLVDPMLVMDEDHIKELMLLAVIARSCLDVKQARHQSMPDILQMLQNPAFFLAVAGQS